MASDAAHPLQAEQFERLDAWWRAANYLAVGMIYLQDNPLLREPLKPEHIKTACSATGARAPVRPSSGPIPIG